MSLSEEQVEGGLIFLLSPGTVVFTVLIKEMDIGTQSILGFFRPLFLKHSMWQRQMSASLLGVIAAQP